MNIYAYTAPGTNYPEFISVNMLGDEVEIIVRTAAWGDGTCGNTASIRLSKNRALDLSAALLIGTETTQETQNDGKNGSVQSQG